MRARSLIFSALFVLLGLVADLAIAQERPPACGKAVVFYVNGVLASKSDAIGSAIKLRKRLEKADVAPADWMNKVAVLSAYNPSLGYAEDFFEAASQSVNGDLVTLWRIVKGLVAPGPTLLGLLQEVWLTEETRRSTLEEHAALYKSFIDVGRSVVLVAHSQGNFFADRAPRLLSESDQESVSLVPVASPTTRSPFQLTGIIHHTLFSDKVIAFVRAVGRPTLPPNFSLSGPSGDVFDHYFDKTYMEDRFIRGNIAAVVGFARFRTPQPTACR